MPTIHKHDRVHTGSPGHSRHLRARGFRNPPRLGCSLCALAAEAWVRGHMLTRPRPRVTLPPTCARQERLHHAQKTTGGDDL
eukprot:5103587-Heterocapsa_arctica.AAC.1